MIRQLFNILRPKALLLAAVVAAGCSDDDTAGGGEMTFLGGDYRGKEQRLRTEYVEKLTDHILLNF